jgi:hypothetical protein
MIKFFKRLYNKIKLELWYRKRLREIKKKPPYNNKFY